MKKAIKDLCLVLGFVSMTLAADASASQSNNNVSLENYDVENGLIGMNRDINTKLTKRMKSDKDIAELVGTSVEYLTWIKHISFKNTLLHGRRYYLISQLDKSNKKSRREIYNYLEEISETPLFCNLMPKDFATNYPGHPCLLSFITNRHGSYSNSRDFTRNCLLRMLDRIWEETAHNIKNFNEKVHADVDDQGNSMFAILGRLYAEAEDYPISAIFDVCAFGWHNVDLRMSGSNGKTLLAYLPADLISTIAFNE
jgi:hypothetical protein